MQREEFETRIRELLPGSSEIALATVTTYAEEPDELAIELSDGAGHFLGGTTGRILHKAYSTTGNGISSTPRSCALWQGWLRRAALWNKLWTASRPSDVWSRMPRAQSLRRFCPGFKTEREKSLRCPFPPRSQRPAAWKWGEALSLFLILWRPLLWTTSSTGFMARW